MKLRLVLLSLLVPLLIQPAPAADLVVPTPGLTPQEIADGWISLFDGETLFGWQAAGKGNWKVVDQTIAVSSGDVGLLHTTAQFDDYVLKLEFRSDRTTNSGVFLRTLPKPTRPGLDCYELNIAPSENPFPTGSLVGQAKCDLFAFDDQWHEFEVVVEQAQVTVKIDGKTVVEYQGEGPRGRGYIGLQHNQGAAAFRRIRLKPLRLNPLFDGKTLKGWKVYPEMASRFSVTDKGELHLENGKGQLESQQQWGDFVFQAACFVNGDRLNSGIFFRCIPGETMNGYESQIHNGMVAADPAKPEDCGTGGIFRRQNARRIVAQDRTWLYKTIVATGPHISVWVNGYQVTDWTDTRKPDPNPRKGLRQEAGTVMLQGHDPTTNFLFKQLAARELDPAATASK